MTANGSYKSVTVIVSSKFIPVDGLWIGKADFMISHNDVSTGSLQTVTTTSKGGSKCHYWGTTELVTNQRTVLTHIVKGDFISIGLSSSSRHKETTLIVILGS